MRQELRHQRSSLSSDSLLQLLHQRQRLNRRQLMRRSLSKRLEPLDLV